jgi:hypothetical protein
MSSNDTVCSIKSGAKYMSQDLKTWRIGNDLTNGNKTAKVLKIPHINSTKFNLFFCSFFITMTQDVKNSLILILTFFKI